MLDKVGWPKKMSLVFKCFKLNDVIRSQFAFCCILPSCFLFSDIEIFSFFNLPVWSKNPLIEMCCVLKTISVFFFFFLFLLPTRIVPVICWIPASRLCFSQVRYRAEWSSATAFNSLLISPHMLVDHMPDMVHKALLSLTKERHSSLCPSSASNAHLNVIWAPTASSSGPEMTVAVNAQGDWRRLRRLRLTLGEQFDSSDFI